MSGLEYRKALPDDAERICYIVQHTKEVVYPDYYTQAVVEFFGRLHSFDNIKIDIEQGRIYGHTENHITRVYVLPEYQGQGFGTLIMDELEKEIFLHFEDCELDASLPACIFYEDRGYKTVKHIKYEIGDGKFMIYEIMKKRRTKNE